MCLKHVETGFVSIKDERGKFWCELVAPSGQKGFWLGTCFFTLLNGVFSVYFCYNMKAPAGLCPPSQQNVATSDILQGSLEPFAIQGVA